MDFLLQNIKKTYLWAGAISLTCCILMVLFPGAALFSAQKSISLWANDVVPALLPFFICANFLSSVGIISMLKPEIFPFAMSVLSGYPMGAKIIGDMVRTETVNRAKAMHLISFCSTSGPTFIIGAVGIGMLQDVKAGVIIASAHYLAALFNGILYYRILKSRSVQIHSHKKNPTAKGNYIKGGLLDNFTNAVFSSFKALGIILAYIVLFMFLTDLLQMTGTFDLVDNPQLRAITKGFFEMTVGCNSLSQEIDMSMTIKCVMSSILISWGGLSVIGQSMSMLSGININPGYILLTKVTHSLLAGVTAFLICSFVV